MIVVLVLVGAGHRTPASAQGSPAGLAVEGVVYEESAGGGTVSLQASGAIPAFTCTVPSMGSPALVIEVRGATTRLAGRLDLKNTLVPEASIEATPSGVAGVRVRLAVGQGTLLGIEQAARGLVFRFGRASSQANGEYRIGVGDKLEINVFGHEDLTKVVEVRSDGTINYPLIGDMRVAGQTAAQIDADLTRVLARDFLVDPQVSVDVRDYQSQWVTVIGEVRNPGKYILKRNMRVIDALAEAGGATKEAGFRILVTRQSAEGSPRQIALDRSRMLSQDSEEANITLEHGDIITVSDRELFYIRGEVARPGPYQFESGMTILKAISYAGGFSQFANRKHVAVLRARTSGVQKKITVNVKAIEDGKAEDQELHPGDTIIVPRRIF